MNKDNKTSERQGCGRWRDGTHLPQTNGTKICRLKKAGMATVVEFSVLTEWDTSYPYDMFEWLDESPCECQQLRKALKKYSNHLPTCYINQDWTPAYQAMADTPNEYRDESYHIALEEMNEKRSQCTCGLAAAIASASDAPPKTVGQILTEAVELHELNPATVDKEIGLPKGIMTKLMNDEFYTNSVPVVLFKNLLLSLHVPFTTIEPAMLPTLKLLLSKETPETIKKKRSGYMLWENEESVLKYTKHLKEIMVSDGKQKEE